jgi:FkbM family methyltransferase
MVFVMNALQQKISSKIESQKINAGEDLTLDYFSWGRDKRHVVDNTEKMPPILTTRTLLRGLLRLFRRCLSEPKVEGIEKYEQFNESYLLMSDEYSKNLFVELLAMQMLGETRMQLSSFTRDLVESYEKASDQISDSAESLKVYKWILKKINLNNPSITFFTSPEALNIASVDRLYCYKRGGIVVDVVAGDTVIDAGIGWGDTVVYLASKAMSNDGNKYYAFDIVEEGLLALKKQLGLNPQITNVVPVLKALSDKNGEVFISDESSPGSRVEGASTGRSISSITIDSFVFEQKCEKVNFIKMDIEGSEIPALNGARETIRRHKPKLAISVYHKWDDLKIIPRLINDACPSYKFYLDCTTGFGGEAVLYCI